MSKKYNSLKTKAVTIMLDSESIEMLKKISDDANKSMSLVISELIKKEGVKNEIFN